jgi:acyl-CoA synthetase (AMP-forming)/AMP-acid ligase II/3-hydroxymyristoyl/3-hydroxydecanoyl-(acyl carrier protein) dehydratase
MRLPPALHARASSWRSTIRVTPGTRLAVFLDDRHEFTAVLFAAWAEQKTVILPGDNLPGTVTALAPHVDAFVGDFPNALQPGAGLNEPLPDPDPQHDGLVVFTSGSTGAPTAIPKKLCQLFDEVATLDATFGPRLASDATIFSTVSHQHIYGLLCSVLWPIHSGRALTARRIEYPEQLQEDLARAPCVLITSPAHLKRLPDVPRWTTRLEAVFSSGGPLPPEGAAKCVAVLGHQPIELYGSSETGGIAWRQGTPSWTPLRGVELRASSHGTLELRSPHLVDDHWFITSDLVSFEGATFTLRGRADRIAKIEEKRVSLELIERTACATGLLSEAKVVVLDGARVTIGLVGVPSAEGRTLDRKDLIDHLKERLADAVERVAIPRKYRFFAALPVNAQGKVTDAALKAAFDDVPVTKPAPIPPTLPRSYDQPRPDARWVDRTETHAELALEISQELEVLEGHFPEQPVVPGVAQLHWAIGWGREAFACQGHLARMEVLKFQALMLPGHQVKLVLDWNAEKSSLTFKFSSQTAVYSSGRVVLTA